jgi:hypothetical protein
VGSIIITIPDIPDANLIYDEAETRRILKFFWPSFSGQIDSLTITNDTRAFAQTAMIAAIDGSYAMGYINLLWDAITDRITHPNGDVTELARRLARNFISHWWHHATRQDVENARIYDAVRLDIARSLRRQFDNFLNGIALRRGSTTIALV